MNQSNLYAQIDKKLIHVYKILYSTRLTAIYVEVFLNNIFIICKIIISNVAVTWLEYCRYVVKLYPINQSINQSIISNENVSLSS